MHRAGKFIVDVVAPALCVCAIAYFAYGAIAGATGYRELSALRLEAGERAQEVDALTALRTELEGHANQLNPKALDLDLIDERVRAILGFTHERDLVLPREELERILTRSGASPSSSQTNPQSKGR